MRKKTIALLIGWKVLVVVAFLLVSGVLPIQEKYLSLQYGTGLPTWVSIWGSFDGYQYLRIAEKGYQSDNLPFFPLYPFSIYILRRATLIPLLPAGLIISHLAFFATLYVCYKLLKLEGLGESWLQFLFILLIFPTAFFYGAVYNDSLFLLWSVLCIYFARKRSWILASIMGSLATFTRLNGLALAIFLAVEYLSLSKEWRRINSMRGVRDFFSKFFRSGIWMGFLIPGAYLMYLYYIEVNFGSWKMIHQAMVVWGQDKVVFPLQVVYRYIKIFMTIRPDTLPYLRAGVEFLFATFYFLVSVYAWKKIRFSYWVLMVVSFIIPSLTGTFAGFPRYALHLFPFFLSLLYLWKELNRFQKGAFVFGCLFFQVLILILFSHGYFIT